jgi:hypothetical protein
MFLILNLFFKQMICSISGLRVGWDNPIPSRGTLFNKIPSHETEWDGISEKHPIPWDEKFLKDIPSHRTKNFREVTHPMGQEIFENISLHPMGRETFSEHPTDPMRRIFFAEICFYYEQFGPFCCRCLSR